MDQFYHKVEHPNITLVIKMEEESKPTDFLSFSTSFDLYCYCVTTLFSLLLLISLSAWHHFSSQTEQKAFKLAAIDAICHGRGIEIEAERGFRGQRLERHQHSYKHKGE